ncbi:MAG TPA: GMP/IMP nucleotidase [Burkholderiales bacterium]
MIAWDRVDTVLLDMDGTLLDLRFDNHFWQEHLPRRYAERHGLDVAAARAELTARYRRVEGTLHWYCVDYWTRELGLDVALLKREVEHLIAVHPHVLEFLGAARAAGKRLLLATNAHTAALALKLERTRLGAYFDAVVSAHQFGAPKEHRGFWQALARAHPFAPPRAVLFDDSLPVLRAAAAYGIGQVVAMKRPDSGGPERQVAEFPAIADFREAMAGLG